MRPTPCCAPTVSAVVTALAVLVLVGATDLAAQRPPAGVIVAEVRSQPLTQELTFVGSVYPRRETIVASQTDGIVVGRPKEAGQVVRRGEAVYRLDNDQLRASLIAALADVKLQRSRQEQSAELLTQDAISEDAALEAEVELDRARSQLQDLQSRLEDLTIRSPFAGHIIEPLVELGEWVNRGDGVVRIVSTDTVRVYINVPERHVSHLQTGDTARVVIKALGNEPIEAQIVAILAQGYVDSRTFPVIVQFLNPTGRVRGGMAADVTLAVNEPGEALLVHKDAVVNSVHGTYLFVIQDGVAIQKAVQPGLSHKGYVAVEGDLVPGDLAIVRGNERLQDGQAVRVVRKLQ